MYRTIVLTLDRSQLAEQAIPHALAIAKAFGATIELVTVVPALNKDAMLAAGVNINWEGEVAQSEDYLKGMMSRLQEEGVRCRMEVRRGEVTEEILRHTQETKAELIVMSTHGRSGLGRWVYGSVADRVLRFAGIPVLLVRASDH